MAWVSSYFISLNHLKTKKTHMAECIASLHWRSRRSKRLSPLSSWVRFSLRTHVKRVGQRSAESRGFSPGAPVSSHRESEHVVGWISRKVTLPP